VADYPGKCPDVWEQGGFFVPLHDREATWLSFWTFEPVALLVGAGGINALTGKPLGTKLEKDGYLVTPPQPWLDGWKSPHGTVYQFVAAPYEAGKGVTVGEQILGDKSVSGGLGLALFRAKDPSSLKPYHKPHELWGGDPYGPTPHQSFIGGAFHGGKMKMAASMPTAHVFSASVQHRTSFKGAEMGLGKGGEIVQKVYADPHGLEAWKELPEATMAVYLVNSVAFKEITGIDMPAPVGQEQYQGKWFGLGDAAEKDVAGSDTFVGLHSVFAPKVEAK